MLFLVRHGEAAPPRPGGDDRDRTLTPQGRLESRHAGLALREAGFTLSIVVTSPLVRAVQTAELLVAGLGYDGLVVADPAFAPDESAREALARLPLADGRHAMVVCHEPIVRSIASLLLGTSVAPFATAGIMGIEGQKLAFTHRLDR